MKRFILFKNGKAIGDFMSEREARIKFLFACRQSSFMDDEVILVDLDKGALIIAHF